MARQLQTRSFLKPLTIKRLAQVSAWAKGALRSYRQGRRSVPAPPLSSPFRLSPPPICLFPSSLPLSSSLRLLSPRSSDFLHAGQSVWNGSLYRVRPTTGVRPTTVSACICTRRLRSVRVKTQPGLVSKRSRGCSPDIISRMQIYFPFFLSRVYELTRSVRSRRDRDVCIRIFAAFPFKFSVFEGSDAFRGGAMCRCLSIAAASIIAKVLFITSCFSASLHLPAFFIGDLCVFVQHF